MKYLLVSDDEGFFTICSTLERAKSLADDLVGDGYIEFEIYELNAPILEGSIGAVIWREKKE